MKKNLIIALLLCFALVFVMVSCGDNTLDDVDGTESEIDSSSESQEAEGEDNQSPDGENESESTTEGDNSENNESNNDSNDDSNNETIKGSEESRPVADLQPDGTIGELPPVILS